jgi:CheY-like chemotaxis protein
MPSLHPIVIIGAGPAGMMLAYQLASNGVAVRVLERHRDFERDVVLRSSIQRMLIVARAFAVTEAIDGADAVDQVESGGRFDLVLMDLMMPRMNGRQALDRLRVIAPELADRTVICPAARATTIFGRGLGASGRGGSC